MTAFQWIGALLVLWAVVSFAIYRWEVKGWF